MNKNATAKTVQSTSGKRMKALFQDGLIVLILIGMTAIFGIANHNFFNYDNVMNILRQVSVYGIMAVGMTFVLVCGEIDISIGSVVGLSGIAVSYVILFSGMGMITSTIVVVLCMGLIGLFNGVIVANFKVPSMLVTMGAQMAARGAAYVVTNGHAVDGLPEWFANWGRNYFLSVPIPVIFMLVIILLGWIILTYTKFGRNMYAVGGNVEAAKLCGINTKFITVSAMTISSMLAGFSGVIWASRLNSGQPTVGVSYEMQVIAGCVIGGASLRGGKGNVLMSLVGAILLGVLYNGLNLLRVSSYWQQVATGLIIILAIVIDSLRNLVKN